MFSFSCLSLLVLPSPFTLLWAVPEVLRALQFLPLVFPCPFTICLSSQGGRKIPCLVWRLLSGVFQVSFYHLGMEGVGGNSSFSDFSLGLAKRGRFGTYYFLSLPLRGFGKLYFLKLVFPRDVGNKYAFLTLTVPINHCSPV